MFAFLGRILLEGGKIAWRYGPQLIRLFAALATASDLLKPEEQQSKPIDLRRTDAPLEALVKACLQLSQSSSEPTGRDFLRHLLIINAASWLLLKSTKPEAAQTVLRDEAFMTRVPSDVSREATSIANALEER